MPAHEHKTAGFFVYRYYCSHNALHKARVPGNDNFDQRMEMMCLAKRVFGRFAYRTTIALFLLNLQLANITAIIQSTQTMDFTVIAMAAKTCGLELYPDPGWKCVGDGGVGLGGGMIRVSFSQCCSHARPSLFEYSHELTT